MAALQSAQASSVTDAINRVHDTPSTTIGSPSRDGISGHPMTPPINLAAAYSFSSAGDLIGYHDNKHDGHRYCRDSNETVNQLETYFAAMHGAEFRAMAFGSGMAAVFATLETLIGPGTTIFLPVEIYRKAREITRDIVRRSKDTHLREYRCLSEIDLSGTKTPLIWAESPSNPHLRLIDYGRLEEFAQDHDAVIALDLTFSGLMNFRAPNFADVIVHSCTKYISGHNDVIGGVAIMKEKWHRSFWDKRSAMGNILDPFSAYLLIRSLRTYDLRMNAQVDNAQRFIECLKSKPSVSRIFYPGKEANADQAVIFKKYHSHGGAVVSFTVEKDPNDLMAAVEELKSTKMAPNFGSVDTQFEVPSFMSHYGKEQSFLDEIGLERNLVRYSIGCERFERIEEDLDRML